jgi:hypothetical protein
MRKLMGSLAWQTSIQGPTIPTEMPMKKAIPAANPNAYVTALSGWRRKTVESLRRAVAKEKELDEAIKWGHLVYSC